ncbi:MAG: metallo-mystery pair system four-Cys motif protein [Gemmatimonadaceae bacterium]|nr:metallo-mystery pair system four-Cys motif protein [Gemmatimonadaceae bacterium]
MHPRTLVRRLAAGALAVVPLVAFTRAPRAADARRPITLHFAAVVGDQPFACGRSYAGIGTAKSTITPSEFRMFISQVELLTADGTAVPMALEQDGTWQSQGLAMLDFEDGTGPCVNGTPALRTTITGDAPAGRYVGVRFEIGVPFERNHGDLAAQPAPLSITRMFWAWNSGHKFVRLDAKTESGKNWVLHLGSTDCMPNEKATEPPTRCGHANRVTVAFDRFDPDADLIVADVAALYAGSDLENNQPRTAAGCMSGPSDADCGPVFKVLGLAFGDAPAGPQSWLRAQPGAARAAADRE